LNFKKMMFAAVLTAMAVVPASAGTITFTGTCSDCTGTVTGTLVLTDSGSTLSTADFVSFTYGGSNLLTSYTINAGDFSLFVSGSIPGTLPSTANVDISNGSFFFQSFSGGESDGFWDTGRSGNSTRPSDQGINGVYNAATTPEPTTWAMLGAALVGLVVFRRKLMSAL
jgi:PEP-CTERM motif